MKRFLRLSFLILTAVLILALMPNQASAMTVTTPTQSVTSSAYFSALPGVYEMGDGYAVIWATNFKGTGYIKYTYQGKTYTVYDMKNGIIRTGDTIHVVKVPHEHLQGNSYTVYSRQVTSHDGVYTNYGTTISAGPITLKAYDGGVDDFDMLVLTDVHGNLNWAKTIASRFTEDPDMVVFSGDIADSIDSMDAIVNMFNIMGTVTGGRYPTIYCRGNHETRGAYSTTLLEYFPTETGEFYIDFRYGPLWGVVMDTGEDKDDTSVEYGNLANYKEYTLKQEAWLRSLRMDETATFRFGIYHMPRLHDLTSDVDFTDSIGHLGIQFGVTGHLHAAEVYDKVLNKGTRIQHDGFIAGGYEIDAATMVTLKNSTKKAYVTVKKQNGSIYGGYNKTAFALSDYVGEVPAPMDAPTPGLLNQFNPGTASKGTVSINVPPAVFETGGDWYNIVWTTKTTDSDAIGMTGYVEYEYNGQTYQVFDEVGGYRRSYDEIHTVRVPKEHLNNNSYRVGTFLVHFAYKHPNNVGRYYVPGDWVESQTYVFEDRSADTALNIVACPDIKTNGTGSSMLDALEQSVAALGTSPAYILLNGDVVNNVLNSTSDYVNFFMAAAKVSGGIHPVIFSRGNAECRGYYSPNLLKYIPTATGEFYYSVQAGEYTIVNLDTGEDKKDSDSKFGGRVAFDALRAEQVDWINTLPSGKLVVVGHMAAASCVTRYGVDYETSLVKKGAVFSIGGHDTNHGFYYETGTTDGYYIYTAIPGGWNGSRYTSLQVMLGGDYAYLKASQYSNGSVSYPTDKVVDLSTGWDVSAYSAVKPSKVNGVYQVTKPGHIKWISNNCTGTNNFAGETFMLMNDIDMKMVPHTPIGGNDSVFNDFNSTSRGFAGTFDGNGYTISNVNIAASGNNVGFFGVVRNGAVKRLTISGGMVTGGAFVGGLVGFASGATISDCYSDITVYSPSGSKIGGMAGFLGSGSVVDGCANYGHVSTHAGGNLSGGVIGQIHSNSVVTVQNSFNRGAVTNHSGNGVAGGIYGYSDAVPVKVVNCYNASDVACPGSSGAIVGGYSSDGTMVITNTYFDNGYNGASTAFPRMNNWNNKAGSGSAYPKTSEEMHTRAMAKALNEAAFTYIPSMNDGYPVQTNQLHADGKHSYNAVVKAPTCMEDGYTTYTCSCGDSYVSNRVASAGHSYNAVVTAPTCTEDGYTTYTCVCGDSYVTDRIAAKGHSYNAVVKAPTCTEDGYTTNTCVCGDSYVTNRIAAKGHSHTAVVTAPTCTAEGYTTYACSCGDSYVSNVVPALGHAYSTVVVDPTCIAAGSVTTTCSNCGETAVEVTPATGHAYDAYVTEPTCTNSGYTTFVCVKCSDCYVANVVEAKGHNHQAMVTAPTCMEGGYTTYTCHCGDSYVADQTQSTGHNYVDGICGNCGGVDPDYIDPSIPYSLVGDMNEWTELIHIFKGDDALSVTMTLQEGTYRFKIRRSYLELGNDSVIYNATPDGSGLHMTTSAGSCTLNVSGGTYRFTFDPATGMLAIVRLTNETEDAPIVNGTITLKTATLSLEDEIVYNIYFVTENVPVSEDAMGLIIWDEEPVLATINGGGTVIEGATYLPDSNRYGISSMGVPAKNLGDLKYMVVYARLADGTYVYSRLLQYSARIYCMSRLEKSSDENMRALCVAMMNYGAEAQKYFAANTDYTYTTLMNEGFEEYQALVKPYSSDLLMMPSAVGEEKAGEFGISPNGFTRRTASMSADGTFALNYYFTASVPTQQMTMYYWTEEQFNSVATLTPENASGIQEMVATEGVNQFWAKYDGIAAKEMDETVYVCGVYEVDGVTYSTGVIAYSMAKYCIGKAEISCEIQDFAKAIAVYGYHAKTYFKK